MLKWVYAPVALGFSLLLTGAPSYATEDPFSILPEKSCELALTKSDDQEQELAAFAEAPSQSKFTRWGNAWENRVVDELEMKELAVALGRANPEVLEALGIPLSSFTLENVTLEELGRVPSHPRYRHFFAKVNVPSEYGRLRTVSLDIRSNGKAAFLSRTFIYHQTRYGPKGPFSGPTRFNWVYRNSRSEIRSADQAEFVIRTLPETVTLSRTMSFEEYELWKAGRYEEVQSAYQDRTFFALNQFVFKGTHDSITPIYAVPRSTLRELLDSGKLVVNTYDDDVHSNLYQGMGSEARSPFGLEVEIVIQGEEARYALAPYLRKPIKAYVLHWIIRPQWGTAGKNELKEITP